MDFGDAPETQKDGAKALIKNALAAGLSSTKDLVKHIENQSSDAHEDEEFDYLKKLAIKGLRSKG